MKNIHFINLDISKVTKVTDYGFQKDSSPLPEILFRIYDEHYVIDYDKFTDLRITTRLDKTNETNVYTLNSRNIVTIDGDKYVKWTLSSNLIDDMDKLFVDIRVKMFNKTVILNTFKILIYEESGTGMNGILQAIRNFNQMYDLYLKSIKRTEIGQPNGVVPLGSDGRFDYQYMPLDITKHIPQKLYDTLFTIHDIHGLRINKKTYELEYYDSDDKEWYIANSINGGKFGYPNKPSPQFDVFGGYFTDGQGNTLDGGTFTDDITIAADGGLISDNLNILYDGGKFTDKPPPIGGGGFTDKKDPVHGGGFG